MSMLVALVIGPRAQFEPYEGWDDRYIAGLPPKVQRALLRERKLEEATGSDRARAAIHYILGINWKASPRPSIDLQEARRVLDDSHAGLVEVKEAVLDWLATQEWSRRKGLPAGAGGGTSLCLIGPPGTGKTSIATSIATAAKRHMESIGLAGADTVFLLGSDSAYMGARPGEIVRRLLSSQKFSGDLTILLDEVDKINRAPMRDPLPVILHLLDPSRNHAVNDQYLDGVDLDFSQTLFIATANEEADIPGPLRDRLRLLSLPGYTRDEQMAIGSAHILPRMLKRLGITNEVELRPEVVECLVADYPLTKGMRQLEQRLSTVVSRALRCHLETGKSIHVNAGVARSWVGVGEASKAIGFQMPSTGRPRRELPRQVDR
jgi:ATP-dependent Lon protease